MLTICRGTLVAVTMLALASAAGAADRTLWCPAEGEIHLDACTDERPEEGEVTPLRERDGCVGEPGLTDVDPVCRRVALLDEWRNPIPVPCMIILSKGDGGVVLESRASSGGFELPRWPSRAAVACRGYEDRTLDEDFEGGRLILRPGRVVTIHTTPTGPAVVKSPQAELRLTSDAAGATIERDLVPGEVVSLGSLPLGGYHLSISGKGVAEIVDSFRLQEGAEPLALAYPLERGRCVRLEIDCGPCARPDLAYSLARRLGSGLLEPQAVGPLDVTRKGESRWAGRLCGLAAGEYELEVSGRALTSAVLPLEIGDADVALPPVSLEAGLQTQVWVVDESGLPVTSADVGMGWRDAKGPRRVTRETGADGAAVLPAVEATAKVRLWVGKDGFVSERREARAGDELVIRLEHGPRITGRVVAEACDTGEVWVELAEPQPGPPDQGEMWAPVEKRAIPDCAIDLSLSKPRAYRISVLAPDAVPHRECLALSAGAEHDLGVIRLERGMEVDVAVRHGGMPVPGVEVSLEGYGPPEISDDGGRATFSSVGEGTSEVTVLAHHPDFAPVRQRSEVMPGREIGVDLVRGGSISGLVVRQDGSPAAGESITALGPDVSLRSAPVRANGTYALDRLTPGRWQVSRQTIVATRGSARMGTGDTQFVTLRDGESARVDFVPQTPISGRVFLDGQPLANGRVGAARFGDGTASASIALNTDANGTYAVALPGAGIWRFSSSGAASPSIQVPTTCPCVIDLYLTTRP